MARKKTASAQKKMNAQELMRAVNDKLKTDAVFSGDDERLTVEYIPTGMLPIDILLGGGFPKGRMCEVYGDYSVLKSVVCLSTCATVQRQGGSAALLDTEHSYEPDWAKRLGVNTKQLILWPPRDDDDEHTGEEAMDVAQTLTANGCDLIVFDSVAAALPQSEAEKRLKGEHVQPARLAQLMSTGLRRLTMSNNKTAFIFTNQVRMNIGVTFGSKEARPGGKALGFYSSYILDVKKTGKITRDVQIHNGEKWVSAKEQIGQQYRATLQKSKLSKPFKEIWFTWNLETGQVDMPNFLTSQGLELGLIQQKGNTWTGFGLKAVGRSNYLHALGGNPAAMFEAENAVREAHGLPLVKPERKTVGSTKKPMVAKKQLRRRL